MWPRAYIVGNEGETVPPVMCKNKGSTRSRSSEKLPPGGCLVFGPTLQTFRKGKGVGGSCLRPLSQSGCLPASQHPDPLSLGGLKQRSVLRCPFITSECTLRNDGFIILPCKPEANLPVGRNSYFRIISGDFTFQTKASLNYLRNMCVLCVITFHQLSVS